MSDTTVWIQPMATGTIDSSGSCGWCSLGSNFVWHLSGICPKIKSIEYHPNGTIKRVEFRS